MAVASVAAGVHPPDPVSLAQEYLRNIQVDLSLVGSEQEYLRRLEAAAPHPMAAVSVGVFRILVRQELSILGRPAYAQNPAVAPHLPYWRRSADAAASGRVSFTPKPSPFYAGHELFVVRILGAPGRDGADLEASPIRCFETNLDSALEVAYETLYGTQLKAFGNLHGDLRSALAIVDWLNDQFGHQDPAARAAAERLKTTTAPDPKVVK